MKAKVKKINDILDGLNDEKLDREDKGLDEYLYQICSDLDIPVESDSDNIEGLSEALFSNALDAFKKKKIVARSLMLLSREKDLIWSSMSFRINLFAYYQDQIDPTVYRILNLNSDAENHVKLDRLASIFNIPSIYQVETYP